MKKLILFTAVVLSFHATLRAQLIDPVEFDGSQAIEMEVKWSWQTGETSACSYLPNFCGASGSGAVTFFLDGDMRTWPTSPILDTNGSMATWIDGKRSGTVYPIDYDGLEPTEYINLFGYLFTCLGNGNMLKAVDTIPASSTVPGWVTDINGDGRLDVAFPTAFRMWDKAELFRVALAGPEMGRSAERVVHFPNPFIGTQQANRDALAMRLMRCGDGQLRIVYCGTPRRGQSGIWLLNVHLQKRDSGWSVEYTVADSIVQNYQHNNDAPNEPWVVRPITCVDDPNTKRQWAIVNWEQGYHRAGLTTVLYEVTGGKLEERMVHKGQLVSGALSIIVYEGQFDSGEAVVEYANFGSRHLARISTLQKPFAKYYDPTLGNSCVFIDDQYADGSRDLFITSTNGSRRLALVNFDLRPSSVPSPTHDTAWAILQGSYLLVRVPIPTTVAVDAVHPDGRTTPLRRLVLQQGEHRVDLTEKLRALPVGAVFIRIMDDKRVVTIPFLR